ncbi:MAG: signal peptidase I [Candidatus Moranbacteria bacterium]|jgi:signal peptidase I|nr:signal peptidase I [Candidatus Moranbacteria bacterium]
MEYSEGKNGDGDEITEDREELYQGVGGFFMEIIKIFILAIIVILPIRMFLFQPFFVQGASMEPNFEDGQYLIINEFGYKETDLKVGKIDSFKEMTRGEVIVFRYPLNPKQFFIKRVIGLPGERITVENGEIHIYNQENPNGFKLEESYLPQGLATKGSKDYSIKEDEYYVLGDNRNHSSDSRMWGPIRSKDVVGRVLLRAWPISDAKLFVD